ncbi:hypothetical protein GCM10010339_77930 [Streptomyces alanosinicus]|uniref:4-hydroxy-tetrahydrodipicolinate synthase n=1 Tax=Streptomyces alanosinicus TaxID=68171 RepID=A0A918YRX0_9ACTN|nr:hypothetical protein GCM10010339_77930 [Streptomyces alanosinicus]
MRARAAEQAGAHGLLAVAPYYSKPPQEGVLQHFLTIANVTGLPVSGVSHLVTRQLRGLLEAHLLGDVVKAAEFHRHLLPVYTGMFRTQGVISTKAALAMAGLPAGPLKPPMVGLDAAGCEQLAEDLAAVLPVTA